MKNVVLKKVQIELRYHYKIDFSNRKFGDEESTAKKVKHDTEQEKRQFSHNMIYHNTITNN